jgi:hypothetical protein
MHGNEANDFRRCCIGVEDGETRVQFFAEEENEYGTEFVVLDLCTNIIRIKKWTISTHFIVIFVKHGGWH